jgi:hypothetical protein
MSNRDATKKARGFSYQRQYGIYLFFNSINSNIIEIIEEGNLDGSTYEDITTKNNNNEYITYQIKYHTGQMRFNRSNSDLFKTIKNENNLQSKVKNIYFIVSKNNDTFDDFLSSWKNKKLLSEEIYNSIINLEKDDTKIVKAYKECKTFLQSNPKDKIISYIDKIIIEEGFTYDELIVKINEIIKNTFNVNDNIIIFYLRYYVFDLFDKNWFNDNIPLKINEIYSELKLKFNDISSNSENKEIFNYTFNHIIDKMKKYIALTDEPINTNNLYTELNNFINQLHNKFETKHYLCFLVLSHNVNKKQENIKIVELYNNIVKYLCRSLIKSIKTDNNLTDEKIDKIISSISYYHKHKIDKLISLSKSEFKYVLSNDDLSYVNTITKIT